MFMEIIDNSNHIRTINTDKIIMIFPDGEQTGLSLVDYKVIVHIDMDYNEFMSKFSNNITTNMGVINHE